MLSTLDAAWHYKSQTENCCRVLFMTCWHKFQMIFQQSLYCVQCRQTLAVARGVSGVDTVLLTYREETKQPRHPIADLPLLEFSPALESWFNIYTGPTSCLIVPQTFSFFICHLYLSVAWLMSVLCTERSLLHIMSRHAPFCILATSFFWYSAPTQFSKAFLKNDILHL